MSDRIATKSIILSRVAYGEADWIVTFFSEEHGRMSGIAPSARKSIRRFGSGLEPGALSQLFYATRSSSQLVRLEQSQILLSTTGIMRSLERMEALGRALRLALSFLKEHQPAPEKFELFERYLRLLSNVDPGDAMRFGFELKWLALSGYEPMLDNCVMCGGLPDSARFSPEQGGVICSSCAANITRHVPISGETRMSLGRLLSEPLGSEIPVHGNESISLMLASFIECVLGHPLKS